MVESRLCISNLSACRCSASTESFYSGSQHSYVCCPKQETACVCVCVYARVFLSSLSVPCFAVQNLHNEPHGECRILRAGKERVLGIIVVCM